MPGMMPDGCISYHGTGFPERSVGLMSHNGRTEEIREQHMASQVEVDPQETREWLEALDAVVASDGAQPAPFLPERGGGHRPPTGGGPAAPFPAGARRGPRAAPRRGPRARRHHAVSEHDSAAGRAASSGRRGAR